MSRKLVLCLILALLVSASYGDYLLASWEGVRNNSIDWGNQLPVNDPANMPTKTTGKAGYQYESVVGNTLGDYSLEVTQSGWGQSLALKLSATGRAAFMTHSTFSIDMSVAPSGGVYTSGYSQIYELAMNGEGSGFTGVATGTPINFYWYGGAGERMLTLTVDYSAYRDLLVASPGWVEIVFALNTGGGAPPEMYFDNAKLSGVPEPMTVALLGLGGLFLRKRKI